MISVIKMMQRNRMAVIFVVECRSLMSWFHSVWVIYEVWSLRPCCRGCLWARKGLVRGVVGEKIRSIRFNYSALFHYLWFYRGLYALGGGRQNKLLIGLVSQILSHRLGTSLTFWSKCTRSTSYPNKFSSKPKRENLLRDFEFWNYFAMMHNETRKSHQVNREDSTERISRSFSGILAASGHQS